MRLYANAHWWLAALLPLTVVAFWPLYYSQLPAASLGHHVHGTAGMLWLLLAILQSWSIATRRIALHRAAGRAVYPVIALFVAGGSLAISEMATGYATASDFFRTTFGARLALLDLSAAVAVPLLVRDALVHRRRAARHAASMLATILFILPPMFGRLFQHVPGYPPGFPAGFYGAQLLCAAIGLLLWSRDRTNGGAFLVVALIHVAHCVSFAFYGGAALTRAFALLAPLPTAALAAGVAVLVLRSADRAMPAVARPAAAG